MVQYFFQGSTIIIMVYFTASIGLHITNISMHCVVRFIVKNVS